jgi:hypothetical protein
MGQISNMNLLFEWFHDQCPCKLVKDMTVTINKEGDTREFKAGNIVHLRRIELKARMAVVHATRLDEHTQLMVFMKLDGLVPCYANGTPLNVTLC